MVSFSELYLARMLNWGSKKSYRQEMVGHAYHVGNEMGKDRGEERG